MLKFFGYMAANLEGSQWILNIVFIYLGHLNEWFASEEITWTWKKIPSKALGDFFLFVCLFCMPSKKSSQLGLTTPVRRSFSLAYD